MCIVRERRPAGFLDMKCQTCFVMMHRTGFRPPNAVFSQKTANFVVTAQFCYPSHVPHVHLRFVASSHLREKDQ